MSRQLRRVPLDFSWPMDKVWEGYLNPHRAAKCRPCQGKGLSPGATLFSAQWYGNAPFDAEAYGAKPLTIDHPGIRRLAERHVNSESGFYGSGPVALAREQARLWHLWRGQWSHHLIQADVDALVAADRLWDFKGRSATADDVNAWSLGGFGHDEINQGVCLRARCEREGVPIECKTCGGSGESWSSPELKKAHDDWTPTEPPEGPGYQVWETVSEGSPVSPVFATPEGLVDFMTKPDRYGKGYSRAAAEAFVKAGSSIGSFVYTPETGPVNGIEALVALPKRDDP